VYQWGLIEVGGWRTVADNAVAATQSSKVDDLTTTQIHTHELQRGGGAVLSLVDTLFGARREVRDAA
jgi:hypothetical protein